MKHAGIIGAGILGRLLAFRLQRLGWHVTMFDDAADPLVTSACSYVAAGLLAPLAEVETAGSALYEMGLTSIARWPQILAQLPSPVYFQQAGSILLAHRQDQGELQRFIQLMQTVPQAHASISQLTTTQLQQLEPTLQHFNDAYWLQAEGQLDNQTLLRVLAQHLLQQGVRWIPAATITEFDGAAIYHAGDHYQFTQVFDCRGLGAKPQETSLRGVRGEIYRLRAAENLLTRPVRLMHPRYRLYVAPRPHGEYVIGASEIESEDESPMSVRSALELLSACYSLHPSFAEARILSALTQCRPAYPDNFPRLYCNTQGVIVINGLYRHGYLLAPALIDQAITLLGEDNDLSVVK